jgi:hypothetical protein
MLWLSEWLSIAMTTRTNDLKVVKLLGKNGAGEWIRTTDLLITNKLPE